MGQGAVCNRGASMWHGTRYDGNLIHKNGLESMFLRPLN